MSDPSTVPQPFRPHIQDVAFRGISGQRTPVFFIQIGAADGRRADPIHHFVKRYGWHGVCVEPLTDLFQQLVENYRQHQGLSFENVAITEKEEMRLMRRVPPNKVGKDGVPLWAFGASTLTPEKTRFSRENSSDELNKVLSAAVVSEEVRCISLAALLERHQVKILDVLQIDTEGYDARILKQLDFSRYKPALINMEWQWLTSLEREEVSGLLHRHGYSLHPCDGDLLASAMPLQELDTSSMKPSVEDVVRYFPGIAGLTCHSKVDPLWGEMDQCQVMLVVVRADGRQLQIEMDVARYLFLRSVDGHKTYRQIAAQAGVGEEQLLVWAQELRKLYVLE